MISDDLDGDGLASFWLECGSNKSVSTRNCYKQEELLVSVVHMPL